jgi:hypothetical protein
MATGLDEPLAVEIGDARTLPHERNTLTVARPYGVRRMPEVDKLVDRQQAGRLRLPALPGGYALLARGYAVRA